MGLKFDFTEDNELIELTYGADTFRVTGVAPADTISDLATLADADSNAAKVEGVKVFMRQVLVPEDLDAFIARLSDASNPIGFGALLKTFTTLMEVYTEDVRPTEAPSSSPAGSGSTGSSSTPSAPSEVASIPAAKASRAS